ncbi:MAG: hypothetical protein HYW37_00825 [Candidatus Colwellbacteria bacterium]|nr:hypothetical protein [Candidatus Colwellbacteria bacterium]
MKKIYVNKTDSVAAITEKVIRSGDLEIVLYVPKGAELTVAKGNFGLLKRDADSAKKTILIESTDKETRALAESVGIRSIDPLLGRSRKVVSDIISGTESAINSPPINPKTEPVKLKQAKVKAVPVPKNQFKRKLIFGVSGIAVLGLFTALAVFVLPMAEITLVLEKVPFDFSGSLIVDSKLSGTQVSSQEVRIAGESFVQKKNMTLSFPASGKQLVQKKSTGPIIIYNAFSSKTQSLVKDTRFSTPEGKIFRLDKSVVIPGAQIVDNKIVPAAIDATVTADKPGVEYNVGPVSKLRIPGFQGSSKYDGFYGEMKGATSGGFVGEVRVPTASDISGGKDQIAKSLEEALEAQININFPSDIKVLKGASQFLIKKETIDDIADKDGNFKIAADAEMSILGFKETDLVAAFGSKLSGDFNMTLQIDERVIDYGEPRADFTAGRMSVAVTFKSGWKRQFDPQEFKKSLLGKNETELKASVLSLPGIKSGSVKLWPFWVKSAPIRESRVKIDVRHEL